jgi:hypothetical protein
MKITKITKDLDEKWIFEPWTPNEYEAMQKVVSWLKNQFRIRMKEVNESSPQGNPTVEL